MIEAVARIIHSDQWFPPVSRIIDVALECRAAARARERTRQQSRPAPTQRVVCAYCHGARWVRLGGYDAPGAKPGDQGARVQPCPRCTSSGRYAPDREAEMIAREGGVPDPAGGATPDMSATTWRLPRRSDGAPDIDALYRESRRLRGLDPDIDERMRPAAGWQPLAAAMAPIASERELVTIGAGDDDDWPF